MRIGEIADAGVARLPSFIWHRGIGCILYPCVGPES